MFKAYLLAYSMRFNGFQTKIKIIQILSLTFMLRLISWHSTYTFCRSFVTFGYRLPY